MYFTLQVKLISTVRDIRVLFLILSHACFLFISIKVWVLDATPGKVRPGGDGEDHPGELIAFLSTLPKQVCYVFMALSLMCHIEST